MSLSLIAIPVFLDTTTASPQLFHQWVRMYHYGHQVLPTMAVGTFLLYSYNALKALRNRQKKPSKKGWGIFALAGITTISMLPFTWIFMVPTNSELFRLEEVSKGQPGVMGIKGGKELVVKWAWLHVARSLLPLAGAVVGAVGAFGR